MSKTANQKDDSLIDESNPVGNDHAYYHRLEAYAKITAITTSIIVLAIFGLLLYYIRSIVVIFALAFLASYILSPAIKFFERRNMNRLLTVCIFYAVFVAAVVISVVIILPMIWGELKDLQTGIQSTLSDPDFSRELLARIEDIQDRLSRTFPALKDIDIGAQFDMEKGLSGAASWFLDYVGQLVRTITTYSGKIIWVIIVIILIPFVTFFMLKDAGTIKRSAMRLVPARYSDTTLELLQKIDRQIGRYIRGRIAQSLILSFLTIIILRILGVRYYLVIGGIAGFANLIPYIGPVMIAIPPLLLVAYDYGLIRMIIAGAVLGALQIVDNAILVPLVVGKSVDLHPVVTIFVVFVGGQLFGLLGMIIAVPVASIFIAIFQAFYKEFKGSAVRA
ncbi:AI-2E family transporter [Candidatus Poribacteria bacterium]|nr:AI-2E family transporter [Candidatus Poribacteria bacterium]